MLVTVFLIVVLLVFLLQRVCVEPGNWATCNLSDYLILFTKWEQQSEQVTGNLWGVFFFYLFGTIPAFHSGSHDPFCVSTALL